VELASQVEQMGAQHKYDLTSEVTHLIVGDNTTDKYKYVARERPDIKVITLDWISAIRELWIQDLAIEVDQLERDHAYPTFAGLRICMTGFEDREYTCLWLAAVSYF
jgi:DNA replication regulator DPB11